LNFVKGKKNKKGLLIICSNPEYSFAGDGRNAYLWANELAQRFKTFFMTLNFEGAYGESQNSSDLRIVRINYYNRNLIQKLYSRVIFLLTFVKHMVKIEVVLVYGKVLGIKTIIFLCWIFCKKLIFRSTLFGFDDMMSLTKNFFSKRIYGLIWGYHSISPAFTSSYLKTFGVSKKLFESCQGVKQEHYLHIKRGLKENLKKKLYLPSNLPVFLSVGPLIRRKGISELFYWLDQLKTPFIFLVLGDHQVDNNHYLYKYQREINQNLTMGRELLGEKLILRQADVNMNEYYQLSDLFIINSHQEGVPNSLLEAMSCGLPSIVRRIPGLESFVCFHNFNCVLFNNDSELPPLINKLLEDSNFYNNLSDNSVKFIKSDLDIKIVTRNFIEFFNF
jgi:glycosyltransferase involved in cell wall biosynthesis